MAKGRKKGNPVDNNIEAYQHESDIRKNAVSVSLTLYDTLKRIQNFEK